MAFPVSPTMSQIHSKYFYDSTSNTWKQKFSPPNGGVIKTYQPITFSNSMIQLDSTVGKYALNSFTVAMWINPGATQPAYSNIIDYSHNATGWVVEQNYTNTNTYGFGSGNVFSLTANTWQHLVLWKNGTECKVYVNGIQVSTGSNWTVSYRGDETLYLGGWYSGGRDWNGSIDGLIIYNRALSIEEIKLIKSYSLR